MKAQERPEENEAKRAELIAKLDVCYAELAATTGIFDPRHTAVSKKIRALHVKLLGAEARG